MKRAVLIGLTALLVALAFGTVGRRLYYLLTPPLPVLGQVPAFSLVAADEASVTQAQLAGHVWVADFVFTTCPGLCPILTRQMAKLVGAVQATPGGDDVRFVSFSVDPANDTPAALRAYATRHQADPQRWLFLTGPHAALYALIRDGFHLAVVEAAAGDEKTGELITHSDRFVLVDAQLRIRAYYEGTEEGAVGQIVRDIERLRAE